MITALAVPLPRLLIWQTLGMATSSAQAQQFAGIGTLNEGSLHAALKQHYSQPGDLFELPLGRFVIDIVRNRGQPNELLVEVQTGSFAALGNKLDHLLASYKILLVHPIAVETILEKPGAKPRRSPKRGSIYSLFDELVSIPTLLDHPNLTLDVVLVSVSKVQVADPKARRGRGGFRTVDRRLNHIVDTERFSSVDDLMRLVPPGLPAKFTTRDLAERGDFDRDTARRIAYCLRAACLFDQLDRTAAGIHYRLSA